ncbi:MAG: hypothetical protein Aurels2KO_26890 [Aureliella sp.]
MPFNDDDLIAYLLGDADRELKSQIEQSLESDAATRERIAELRTVLGHLDSFGQDLAPPPNDLVDSTMARIDAELFDSAPSPASSGALSPAVSGGKRSTTFLDAPALALCIGAICCLILPAVLQARYQARKLQCADDLKNNGQQLFSYASNDPAQQYPAIPESGPLAFAGYYVVQLQESALPIRRSSLKCPSLLGFPGYDSPPPTVIDSDSLALLRPRQLEIAQRGMGGDYAYSLGMLQSGKIVAPKLRGSSQVAILADSPVISDAGEKFVAHAGKGMNMLFDDGRVIFVTTDSLNPTGRWPATADYPFRNHRGTHEAGLSPQDSSLAPSHFPPIAR